MLSLGRLGPGLEHVLFGARLGDFALECHKTLLEGFHLSVLTLHLLGQRGRGLLECFATGECLSGQILLVLLQSELRPFVPGTSLRFRLIGLITKALLTGDRHGDSLAQLHQILLHVRHGLIENLDGILGLAHEIVDIGAQQSAEPVEETHGSGRAAV